MKTLLTRSTVAAARIIRRGGTVAFPTETVYGLGADVFDRRAVEKIFRAKGRPADNPLIVHVGSREQIGSLTGEVSETAQKFIRRFFPGPLTLVLPRADRVPPVATAGLETVGIRMPGHRLALEFLQKCRTPVAAPSANLSGRPSPTTWEAVFEDLDGRIDCILQGEIAEIGLESTVLDCTGEIPLVLRAGAVTLEQLREIVPETAVYLLKKDERPKSPGLRHRHYSPRARVILAGDQVTETVENAAFIGLRRPTADFRLVRVCDSFDEYARSLFDFFRRCDRRGIAAIYCETVPEEGIGAALMDRLRRAAED